MNQLLKSPLTSHEFEVLSNKDFFLTKQEVNKKVIELLELTQKKIREFVTTWVFPFPENCHLKNGKISKGENYKMLPWFMLDYPALFTQKNIFAFRTMFWWGECFSCTFLMSGDPFKKFISPLESNLSLLKSKSIFFCINESPWEHHFGEDNYQLIDSLTPGFITEHLEKVGFFKLAVKVNLEDYERVPEWVVGFVRCILGNLEGKSPKTPNITKNLFV